MSLDLVFYVKTGVCHPLIPVIVTLNLKAFAAKVYFKSAFIVSLFVSLAPIFSFFWLIHTCKNMTLIFILFDQIDDKYLESQKELTDLRGQNRCKNVGLV